MIQHRLEHNVQSDMRLTWRVVIEEEEVTLQCRIRLQLDRQNAIVTFLEGEDE